MVTDEMVERVAKAIYAGNVYLPWRQAQQAARDALKAIAETPAPLSDTGSDRG